jgi:hypothetical protein
VQLFGKRRIVVIELFPAGFEVTNELRGVRDILNFRYYEDVVPQQRTDKRLEEVGAYVKIQSGASKSSPQQRSLSVP